MSTPSHELPSRLSERNVILAHLDIRGFLHIIEQLENQIAVTNFLDGFYEICSTQTGAHGGEVIKYMGDSCLSLFADTDAENAIAAVAKIREAFSQFCIDSQVTPTDIRGGLHIGDVIVGQFGPEGFKDVIGKTVNTLFLMSGNGITISEQLYRKLPSDKRSPWRKQSGHVVYVMK